MQEFCLVRSLVLYKPVVVSSSEIAFTTKWKGMKFKWKKIYIKYQFWKGSIEYVWNDLWNDLRKTNGRDWWEGEDRKREIICYEKVKTEYTKISKMVKELYH